LAGGGYDRAMTDATTHLTLWTQARVVGVITVVVTPMPASPTIPASADPALDAYGVRRIW
jgi:hypothetical protein